MSTEKHDETDGTERSPAEVGDDTTEKERLRARIALLETETERLRTEYARARQTQYRRSALALVGLGVLALAGAGLFPAVRTVLIAIGSIGLFGAVLLYYLTPERFVAASVGTQLYNAFADSFEAITADLGLSDERIYVPLDDEAGPVRLFVPQSAAYEVPESAALEAPFVVTEDSRARGLAVHPAGQGLFEEFEQALSGPIADDPDQLGDQLIDALIEQFELVDAAEVDTSTDQLTVALDSAVYGDCTRFDHPVVSFLAVGVARARHQPVSVDVAAGDDRFEYLITVRWDIRTDD
ncbi:hypothetical protein [Halorientalis marina]|uniref:hypothetical protein n=1 Tax=Halorientalis marina TaxID=2931976 RepID=UPI001FF5D15B|nr:hypothetical protein [Halorientalis marina]